MAYDPEAGFSCDTADAINNNFYNLASGYNANFPDGDFNTIEVPPEILALLQQPVERVGVEALTTREFNGSGVFDILMYSSLAQLREEFRAGRITGAGFATAWASLIEQTMSNAVAFTLQKDEAKWKAITAQIEAYKVINELKLAQAQFAIARADFQNKQTDFAYGKAKVQTEIKQQCLIESQVLLNKYDLEEKKPIEKNLLTAELAKAAAETLRIGADTLKINADKAMIDATRLDMLPAQVANTQKQTELYQGQIVSFEANTKIKVAEIYTSVWNTRQALAEPIYTYINDRQIVNLLQTTLGAAPVYSDVFPAYTAEPAPTP